MTAMLPAHLIDTPKRTALAARSTALRTKLKEWEKSFAASHSGQKPGKEDIRACLEISKTYKEYNIVRDVLAGKLGVESLEHAARVSPTARKGGRRNHNARGQSTDREACGGAAYASPPRKAKSSPYQRRNAPHPNLLDPYDPPASASPRPHLLTSIGPTPQRDGKVLGLFDLLSNSGSSLQATPSTNKRKVDSLADSAQADARVGNEWVVAQTPSRKRRKNGDAGGDILDHLNSNTPEGYRRHCRTPASEGKKFMLSQFFATPSTMRFAALAEDPDDSPMGQDAHAQQTPLRSFVLGNQASAAAETKASAFDATPAYLKRSSSFKDRLLSVSASTAGVMNLSKPNPTSLPEIQTGPPTLRRYKSGPRPLSEILRGLRKIEDEQDEDDLDALREIEGGQINVLVKDSQAEAAGAGVEEGGLGQEVEVERENMALTKAWKKKGQKRTTKRVNMRPVKMKPRQENQWVAEDSGSEEADGPEVAEEKSRTTERMMDDVLGSDIPVTMGREVESIEQETNLERRMESGSDVEFQDGSDCDELDERTQSREHDKITINKAEVSKTSRKEGKKKDKDTAHKSKQKKGSTINPNAVSHQNFRSLKIRNKNSKAKGGRGRFGRKAR